MEPITENDVLLFTCGGCHQLAKVLHEITGWPIYAFWNPRWVMTDGDIGDWDIHSFVKTPHKTYLDIEGEHTAEELRDKWAELRIRQVPDFARIEFWNDEFDTFGRARELAPTVLSLYYKKPGNVSKWFRKY